ncbi:hypothetical protein J2X36_005165 [Methylobacterium sp. BE186]|uniref:hypothetical protein n=1 Tax=Methylobacterium sp. BE186 TaxID=2817715 RepID=UPI00285E0DF2|nr:hypothetical protein [Methylobacterium sp. BE186]MDR7040382.1 hypothetical protein [Methylobacterium sp. BE186]
MKTPLDAGHIASLLQANTRRLWPTALLLACAPELGRSMVARVLARGGFNLAVDGTESWRSRVAATAMIVCRIL